MVSAELLAHADSLRAGRHPFVLATVVRARRPTSAKPGDAALLLPDGTMEGVVGGDCAGDTVREQSARLLGTGRSALLRITPEARWDQHEEGVIVVENPCLSGGTLDIFLEAHLPPALVVVFGDAPVARALRAIGRAIGYEMVCGDRQAALPTDTVAVVVATHGHDEQSLLRAALSAGVGYVGLIASRRRGAALLATLGLSEAESARVHTPAGLDIGARTPAEIAISVFAELIACRAEAPEPAPVPRPQAGHACPAHGHSVGIVG